VTIAPGEDATPYPEVESGGGGGPTDIPGQEALPQFTPSPGQKQILPSVSPPVTPPQIIGTAPPLIPGGTQVFFPFKPATNKHGFEGFADHPYDANGCRVVDYHSGGSGRTCRWQADDKEMRARIGENGYKIEANLHIGPPANTRDKEISITSGGPGSTEGNCCGFTTRINIDDGTLQLEAEGPAYTDKIFCKGASCVDRGLSSIGKNLYNKDVQLTWVCTRNGNCNSATYQAIATGPAGTVVSKKLTNPTHSGGTPIIPWRYISVGKNGVANDPHRVRVDSCQTVHFGQPKVTVIPRGAYYGEEGFIDNPDFLI